MQKLKKEKVEKEQKNKITEKLKEEKGITLLALILTVVIMIILAAVTINVALGEGGLVDQAKWAAEQTANVAKSEQEQLDDVADQINDIIAGIGTGDTNSTGGEETNSVETNSVEETNTVETNTIEPEPEPIPEGTITIGEAQWQEDGTANVSITSSEGGYAIQYQINGTEEKGWKTVQDGVVTGVNHGDTIYARLTDGEQYSEIQNKKIEDTTAPEKANIEVTPESVLIGESITAKVTHIDRESGVNISQSKWVLTQSAEEIGTGSDVISQYTGSFTTNSETITIDSSAEGTYYLHVLTTDKAGNKTETVSEAITVEGITGTVTQEGEITWSGGTATLKLATTESKYKIVYKINGEGSWQEYNGTSIIGLNHGDKVKACLTNEGQTTYGPELNITIEDKKVPVVTVTAQGSPTTNSITVTAQTVDNESGMVNSPKYTYYIKKSTEGDKSYKAPSGAENISNAQYTFTGLAQGTNYDIKVEVNGDKAGNIGTGTLTNQTTATVPGADAGLVTGAITASPAVWSSGKASITLTTTTSFQIEYQVGETTGSWTKGNSPVTVGNLNHGNTVYARLTDGTNAGNSASITILDGKEPDVSITVNEVTDTTIKVKVNATDKESGIASDNAYRYYLNEETSPKVISSSDTYTYEGLTASTTYNIRVEVVDKGNNIGSKKVEVQTEEPPGYMDSVLPSAPKISDGMIPVKWNGTNWIKTTTMDSEWYDYANKKWANVVLGDATFDGDILNESESYSMLVWIPRYAYQITSMYHQSGTTAGNVNIEFVDTKNQNKSKTRTYSETYPSYSTGSGMSSYVVHPAFNYGTNKLSGFWMGKFETSSKEGNSGLTDNSTTKTVQIRAGVESWARIRVDLAFTVCIELNKKGNPYGLNTDDKIVDPHMVKNTEWGAVAYLSQNKLYGKGEEVWMNPTYITGKAGTSVNDKDDHGISYQNGQQASTTGNITGVYDMNGCKYEYTASYVKGAVSDDNLTDAASKYKDVYNSYEDTTPKNNKYGDAIYETSSSDSNSMSWYSDYSMFVDNNFPYFKRGAYYDDPSQAGVFGFSYCDGDADDSYISFRVTIPVLS